MKKNKTDKCHYCGHPREDHIIDGLSHKVVCINGATKGCFCLCDAFIELPTKKEILDIIREEDK